MINLEKKKIVFRAEVLNDGWDPFVNWVQDMAMRYHILFNGKILTVVLANKIKIQNYTPDTMHYGMLKEKGYRA